MLSWVREKIAEGRLRWQQTSQQVRFEHFTTISWVVFIFFSFYILFKSKFTKAIASTFTSSGLRFTIDITHNKFITARKFVRFINATKCH